MKNMVKIISVLTAVVLIAVAVVLVIIPRVTGAENAKSGFDRYETVSFTFITRVDFSGEEGEAYLKLVNEAPAERIEELKELIAEEEDDEKKKLLQEELDALSEIEGDVFEEGDTTMDVPMMGIEIKTDSVDEFCDVTGTIQVNASQAEELMAKYDVPEYEVQVKDDKVKVIRTITFEEFAEGAASM